ncbi:MAG TPA: hypothetical protein VJ804_07920 [Acidimicrobiales bacterium]|nr:hypothetical protein [Acidimicrobiales bacterium]
MGARLPGVGDAKVCCTCKQLKPLTECNRLKKAKDGRQYSCRDCNKAYHYANWDRHMAQIRRRVRDRRAANRDFVIAYLRSHPCVDCGEDDIVVLEFDHLRDKLASVSRLVQIAELPAILAEIDKCEVVCANCHRRRTAARGEWYRLRG